MRLQPIRSYAPPQYPTRVEILARPELLRAIPDRWRARPAVVAVLATLASMSCCDLGAGDWFSGSPSSSSGPIGPKRTALANVAPVFEHGKGVASSGGVAATRIVFLTEDEAVRIVLDEAAKAGITFSPKGKTLEDIVLPITSLSPDPATINSPKMRRRASLELDATDASRDISFEFVSGEDRKAWEVGAANASTLDRYDLIGAARAVREGIDAGAPAGTYGVFYDPLPAYVRPPALPPGTFSPTTRAPLSAFSYQPKDHTITVEGKALRFTPGSRSVDVDGKALEMPAATALRDGIAYVPLQFVAQILGGSVTPTEDGKVLVGLPSWKQPRSATVRTLDFGTEVGTIAFDETDQHAMNRATRDISQQELRAQVRDFLAWLKGQGVI